MSRTRRRQKTVQNLWRIWSGSIRISELASWDFTKPSGSSMTKKEMLVIAPIKRIAHVALDDLVGYEIPKQKLIENTEAL